MPGRGVSAGLQQRLSLSAMCLLKCRGREKRSADCARRMLGSASEDPGSIPGSSTHPVRRHVSGGPSLSACRPSIDVSASVAGRIWPQQDGRLRGPRTEPNVECVPRDSCAPDKRRWRDLSAYCKLAGHQHVCRPPQLRTSRTWQVTTHPGDGSRAMPRRQFVADTP
jgi:hypothetical protein